MTAFSDITPSPEDISTIKSYTPSIQELTEETVETVETVDNSPATDAERSALDEATQPTFQPTIPDQGPGERADRFVPPGDWKNPVLKQRMRNQMHLPPLNSIRDLDERIAKVMRFDAVPKDVAALAKDARMAVSAAREAHESARHEDNPRYARDAASKDVVVAKIAEATAAVGNLESLVSDPFTAAAWFEALTKDLDKQRAAAIKALESADKAFAQWRQAIAGAEALAVEQGKWGPGWHTHVDAQTTNPLALIGEIRKALDVARSEDEFINGEYLITDYNGVPPHTLARLKDGAERARGSFAESVYLRLLNPHRDDSPARDTITEKDLRIINTSPIPFLHPDSGKKGTGTWDGGRPDWDK